MNPSSYPIQSSNWRRAILPIALLAIMLVGFGWIRHEQLKQFRVVSTDPNLGQVSQITPYIKIHFNRMLSPDNLSIGTIGGNFIKAKDVSGSTLTVSINTTFDLHKTYGIKIAFVKTASGETIKDKVLSFSAQNIAYQDLPKAQQQAILNNQDQYTGVQKDPILADLPYHSIDFNLTAEVDKGANGKGTLVLNAQLFLSRADTGNEATAIATKKQEVLNYIQSLGFDPAKYTINWQVTLP